MKQNLIFYESILFVFMISISFSYSASTLEKLRFAKPVKSSKVEKDDMVLTRIQKYIYELADKVSKKSDIKLKRKINGQLPDSFPKIMIENAKKKRRKLRERKRKRERAKRTKRERERDKIDRECEREREKIDRE